MKKKMIFGLIALLLLLIYYFKPMVVIDFMKPFNSGTLPKKINTSIYFSSYSNKEFEVSGEDSIKSIISLIENIQIRRILAPPIAYTPKFKNTYRFFLVSQNNKVLTINLLNSDYIEINRTIYKIIHAPDLSKVYRTIILDQSEGTIDDFYYTLIDNNQ